MILSSYYLRNKVRTSLQSIFPSTKKDEDGFCVASSSILESFCITLGNFLYSNSSHKKSVQRNTVTAGTKK